MLGESCPFDHGMDPLVVGPMMQWPLGGAQMGPAGVPPLGGWDWGNGWVHLWKSGRCDSPDLG